MSNECLSARNVLVRITLTLHAATLLMPKDIVP